MVHLFVGMAYSSWCNSLMPFCIMTIEACCVALYSPEKAQTFRNQAVWVVGDVRGKGVTAKTKFGLVCSFSGSACSRVWSCLNIRLWHTTLAMKPRRNNSEQIITRSSQPLSAPLVVPACTARHRKVLGLHSFVPLLHRLLVMYHPAARLCDMLLRTGQSERKSCSKGSEVISREY